MSALAFARSGSSIFGLPRASEFNGRRSMGQSSEMGFRSAEKVRRVKTVIYGGRDETAHRFDNAYASSSNTGRKEGIEQMNASSSRPSQGLADSMKHISNE